jgi:hypothetical protein
LKEIAHLVPAQLPHRGDLHNGIVPFDGSRSFEQKNLVPNRVRSFSERETAQGDGGVYLEKWILEEGFFTWIPSVIHWEGFPPLCHHARCRLATLLEHAAQLPFDGHLERHQAAFGN